MPSTLHDISVVSPLLAAVMAPFSTLFDIPALTEPWFIKRSSTPRPDTAEAIPDATVSIVLSALGLAFNVLANALLIVRFSTTAQWWRVATRLSLVFWVSKVIIALVNLTVFGRLKTNIDALRGEGLWCAVVSLIICGIISILLLLHWCFEVRPNAGLRGKPTREQLAVRVAGRHFMINVTLFVVDVGIVALLGSRVEQWTYVEGMYFAVITFLTIGFGDFYPTHTVTRVLLFGFAIVGIAQLGNIVSMLVTFFASRATAKRAISRMRFERRREEGAERYCRGVKERELSLEQGDNQTQTEASIQATEDPQKIEKGQSNQRQSERFSHTSLKSRLNSLPGRSQSKSKNIAPAPNPNSPHALHQEMAFLHRMGEKQEARMRAVQLWTSITGLVLFWFVGAAIFSGLEDWAYGTALYFSYISFLTIGFGDFAPVTPAGRVVFILYALIAVPIMASFAVHAVQQVFATFSKRQYERSKAKRGIVVGGVRSAGGTGRAVKGKKEKEEGSKEEEGVESGNSKRWKWNRRRKERRRMEREQRWVGQAVEVVSHAELAEQWLEKLEDEVESTVEEAEAEDQEHAKKHNDDRVDAKNEDTVGQAGDASKTPGQRALAVSNADLHLTQLVLSLSLSLEWRARSMLIAQLGSSSASDDPGADAEKAARIILEADRNVQMRVMRGLVREMERMDEAEGDGEEVGAPVIRDSIKKLLEEHNRESSGSDSSSDSSDEETRDGGEGDEKKKRRNKGILEDVRAYREDFAGLLAAGSKLMRLKGRERAIFERRALRGE